MKLLIKKILQISICLSCVVLFLNTTFAIDNGSIGAYPTHNDPNNPQTKSWFIYSLGANETKADSVTVENSSTHSITEKVYPVDATVTQDGAFALLQQTDEKKDIGSWIKLSVSEITLAPKEKKTIPFTVTVPQYVSIGDHAGGIIFEDVKATTDNSQGLNVNLVSRIGVRIYNTVPGVQNSELDIKNFSVDTSNDKLLIHLSLENTGNIFIYPKGNIEIRDQFNNLQQLIDLNNLETQIPGKVTDFEIPTTVSRPIISKMTATLNVTYSSNKVSSSKVDFYYYNQQYLIAIGIIILVIIIAIIIILKRFRKSKKVIKTEI